MYYVLEAYRSTDDNVCLPMVPQRDIDGLAESFAMAGYMVTTYERVFKGASCTSQTGFL